MSDVREIEIKNYNKVRSCCFLKKVASVCGEYIFVETSNDCSIQAVALPTVTVLYRL
jgi:hypothetical protein